MATNIDTLSIEIKSSSAGAAQGIDDLAGALAKLKNNGSVGVAVKNLERLSEALKKMTPAASNASKIASLGAALDSLSKAGSVNKQVNQLTKLAPALNALSKVQVSDTLQGKLAAVATAMEPLGRIKNGGLGTTINALGKLDKVTANLSDDNIAAFADKVQKLSDVVGPLSQKMTPIAAAFRAINSSARSAGSGIKKMSDNVNVSVLNMSNLIIVINGVINALRPVIRLISSSVSQAMEWDGVMFRFGRTFGESAQEAYEWAQRLNEEMGINVQEFMQNSSLYAQMLTGFGVAVEDAQKMATGYTELAYDIWASTNDVYKTFEDASTAVRSAIAGEVEPIRRAGFTITQATLEETAANHGLTISLENATEAQKSYLRYLAMVDQAHSTGTVGSYAREMNTAEGLVRTFTQQLKTLAQTFGSLFLPILTKVMPWLQAFVDILTEAVVAVAAFFGIEIQPVSWGSAGSGLGGVAEDAGAATDALDDAAGAAGKTTKALKELKNATLGIDELNVISPPDPTGGAGGSGGSGSDAGGAGGGFGGLDVDSLWDESIFDQIQSQVDDIKEKLKEWLPVIGTIGGALAGLGIATLLKNIGDALAQMNLLQKLFATLAIVTIEAALVFTFADKYLESGNLLYLVGEALVTAAAGYLLFRAWGPGGAVLALGVSIVAQLVALEMNLADGTIKLSSPETWIQGIATTLMGAFGGAIISKHTGFFAKEGFAIGLAVSATLVLAAIRMGAIESGEISSGSVEAWILEIGSVLTAALAGKWLGAALYTKGGPMGALIGVTAGLVLNLVGTISVKGEDFGNEISDWISTGITAVMTGFTAAKIWKIVSPFVTTALKGLLPKIGTALSGALTTGWSAITGALAAIPVWGWIVAAIAALVGLAIADHDFTDIGEKIGRALGKACGAVANFVADIGSAIWSGLKSAFNWVKEHITWENVKSLVAALFKKETWTEIIWPKVKEIGKSIWDGLWSGVTGGLKNLWGNITEFVNGFIKGFKDGFEIHSPSKKMIQIGKDILAGLIQPLTPTAIRDKLKVMWDKAKSWWSGTSGLEKINIAVSLVKSGWSTVKRWVGSIPILSQAIKLAKSGWSSVKRWIGSIPKLSQAVGLVKSGWSSVKKWVGNMPTLKAKIGLVKSGWTSIKKWLGNLDYKLNFKLPKIGVKWGSKEVLGFKISYPKSFYTYAKGGFPDIGEMFVAREAGPEMVGRIGNKTSVANNDQIVEGISEGVYAAVLAAMRASENGGSQAVNVYLDGRQITAAVEQRQRERGASLMGNQVYAF